MVFSTLDWHYARFYDKRRTPKRKEVPLRTTRKDVARRRLSEMERKFERGMFDPWQPDTGGPQYLSVREAAEAFCEHKAGRVRARTVETYRGILRRWQETLPPGLRLLDVQEKHLRPFIFQPGTANATQRKRHTHLRCFFNFAVKAGLLEASPLSDALKPKREDKQPAWITPAELDRLLTAIDAHREMHVGVPGPTPDVQWLKDAIEVAICTGLRRGELLALRWQDVDLEGCRLHVRNHGEHRTKSGSERVVPLVGPALGALRRRREERPNEDGRVLTGKDGRPIKPDRVSRRFKAMVRKARLRDREDLHLHSLRHSCGAILASQGVSLRIIQQILGHSTQRTTEIYAHLAEGSIAEAMEQAWSA